MIQKPELTNKNILNNLGVRVLLSKASVYKMEAFILVTNDDSS